MITSTFETINWANKKGYENFVSVGTFSNDDENVDDDVCDRLRPGTGPSSTAGNINTLAQRLRGRVLHCSFLWQSTGKCLLKNLVTCLYFFTAITLFQMKSFYCCTIPLKQKIPNFLMETTSDSIWILWTPPNAKQSFESRSKTSLAWYKLQNYKEMPAICIYKSTYKATYVPCRTFIIIRHCFLHFIL